MKIIKTVKELSQAVSNLKESGSVGFVPTMGALHKGHASLVKRCKEENNFVVVSVFVNPTQFNDKNDLKNYPRTEESDAALLESLGCDIMFLPSVEEVYPKQNEEEKEFNFGSLESVMEGEHRPGHFKGVAQVVSKLFSFVSPTRAYFGEKDFQQLAIIRKMVADLELPIEIMGCPTLRAADGLALSSRNTLLSSEQRSAAPVIYLTLKEARKVAEWGDVEHTKKWVIEQINTIEGFEVEYFAIVNAQTLQDLESWEDSCPKRGCIAVKVGSVRLIDNIEL